MSNIVGHNWKIKEYREDFQVISQSTAEKLKEEA